MTVSTNDTISGPYAGTGANTVFAYDFLIQSKTDLLVRKRTNATGAVVTLTVDVDYTVSGVGSAAGGNVTLTTPLASGTSLMIVRDEPSTQNTDITTHGNFLPATFEDAYDKLTYLVKQREHAHSLTLRASDSELAPASFDLGPAVVRSNKLLSFDVNGDVKLMAFDPSTGLVNIAANVDYNNGTSGLSANDVQAAIDEVEARVDTAESNVATNTADVATNTADIATNTADIATNVARLDVHEQFAHCSINLNGTPLPAADSTTQYPLTLSAQSGGFTLSGDGRKVIIPADGTYLLTIETTVAGTAPTSTYVFLMVKLNGSTLQYSTSTETFIGSIQSHFSTSFILNSVSAGDEIGVNVHANGLAINLAQPGLLGLVRIK